MDLLASKIRIANTGISTSIRTPIADSGEWKCNYFMHQSGSQRWDIYLSYECVTLDASPGAGMW